MKNILIKLIKIYQKSFSPDHGMMIIGAARCRFYPTCSQYTLESIEKHGSVKGVLKGITRIVKCNPFHRGGVDPV